MVNISIQLRQNAHEGFDLSGETAKHDDGKTGAYRQHPEEGRCHTNDGHDPRGFPGQDARFVFPFADDAQTSLAVT